MNKFDLKINNIISYFLLNFFLADFKIIKSKVIPEKKNVFLNLC